jgi:hypothetical protein
MTTYIIEDNQLFNEELYKMLDESSDDEDELCQITGLPLDDHSVVLECNHHFNYRALYREICKQKYTFKTYNSDSLTKTQLYKFRESKLDYFIKCPYCRNIQFTILPYYNELNLKELYGINSLDKTLPNSVFITNIQPNTGTDKDYTFTKYGVIFKWGNCQSNHFFEGKCQQCYVATIPYTSLTYCEIHYYTGLKYYKMEEKQKILDKKIEAKKEKEQQMNERQKLLEERNAERILKGLAPLKHLPTIKTKPKNVVIVENVEDVEDQNNSNTEYYECKAILKRGPNKGNNCGCKKIVSNGLCKRHMSKVKVDTNESQVDTNIK